MRALCERVRSSCDCRIEIEHKRRKRKNRKPGEQAERCRPEGQRYTRKQFARRKAVENDMPKRVIDFDALWASDKLASCAEWAQSEYAWLYGLADASGSFEITNLRVIWGRVAAIRKNLTLERLQEIFDEFIARGLLFIWEENGKRYGHWTGSDVPGRLPAPSWRMRLEKLAPPVPREALAAYSARFGGSKEGIAAPAGASTSWRHAAVRDAQAGGLKHELEEPQAQDLGLDLEKDWDLEKEVCPLPQRRQDFLTARAHPVGASPSKARVLGTPNLPVSNRMTETADAQVQTEEAGAGDAGSSPGDFFNAPGDSFAPRSWSLLPAKSASCGEPFCGGDTFAAKNRGHRRYCSEIAPPESTPEDLREIYEGERGELPAAGALTPERRRRCAHWLAAGFTPEEFRAAVRHAAATPFLAGAGDRGWQASFDWLIANRSNVRKVLEGEYAPRGRARAAKSCAERGGLADLYAGVGPRLADCGVRVNPATLERIRARQARIEESARFTPAPEKRAACAALYGVSHGASDADSACDGFPPRAAVLTANRAPKPIACDAQPRASPAAPK
jgi:hypothetical protein